MYNHTSSMETVRGYDMNNNYFFKFRKIDDLEKPENLENIPQKHCKS